MNVNRNKKINLYSKQTFFIIIFIIIVLLFLNFVSAQLSTSLDLFDQENDTETHYKSDDYRVYVGEWTTFFANFTNSSGGGIGQVLWRNPVDLGTGYTVRAFDYEGDGNRSDFIYSEYDNIIAYYGNGTQIFNSANSAFDYAYGMETGDFNNDSHTEIAFTTSGGRFFVLNGSDGSVLFQTPSFGSGYSFKNGDIDDDGRQDDFAVGASSVQGGYGILVFIYNETSGNFQNIWNATDATNVVYEIDISEIPGEENLVGFVDNGGGQTVVYGGDGVRKWTSGDKGTTYSLDFFDQDSDGKEDEVMTGESSDLRVYTETGVEDSDPLPYGVEYEVEKIDLDGDGKYDDILIASNYETVFAYNSDLSLAWTFSPPDKEFESNYRVPYIYSLRVGNVNNDSFDEIIVGGYDYRYWILNLSGGIIGKHYYGFEENVDGEASYIGYYYSDSEGIDILDDVNGDGINEIISDRNTGFVYVGQQVVCKITIDGHYREEYMYYNYSSKLWEYYYQFDDTGFNKSSDFGKNYNWSVTCEKGGYQTQNLTKNISVYLKNSSLDAFDQEDDDEDKAGWLSEQTFLANQSVYFFANYSDLVSNLSLDELSFDTLWNQNMGENRYDVGSFDYDGDGFKDSFAFPALDAIYAYDFNENLLWIRTDTSYDYTYMIRVGDFDNDSNIDLAGISSAGTLWILNSSGSEIYQSTDYYNGYAMESGDINSDGVDDLVIGVQDILGGAANNYGIVAIIYNTTTGNFQEYWTAGDASNYPIEIKISEIPGEENLVGFVDYSGEDDLIIYYGNGTKKWQTSDLANYVSTLDFVDYDGDGKEDEVIAGEYRETYIYDSSGVRVETDANSSSIVYELETIDYDGDGNATDYVYFERYYLRMINKSGDTLWDYYLPESYYSMMQVQDLNNDGVPEIIVGGTNGLFYVFNISGGLVDRINLIFPQNMGGTYTAMIGYAYYGSQAGMAFSESASVNNSVDIGFCAYNSNVGVIKTFPRCTIQFDDGEVSRMDYNSSSALYYYSRNFTSKGAHTWNVTCESVNHVTRSSIKTLNVNTAPGFFLINNSPSTLNNLDPNVSVIVNANISEVNRNFDSAILQWKNSTSNWTNVSMSNSTLKGEYTLMNASFLPSINYEGNYSYRIWANDTIGEGNFSSITTLNISWDCGWRITSGLGTSVGWNLNKHIGDITINNTGDSSYSDNNCSLDFQVTYDLPRGRVFLDGSTYKNKQYLAVTAKSTRVISVNATFSDEPLQESLILTTSEISESTNVSSRNTTATLVSSEPGPYIVNLITSFPSSVYLTPLNFSLKGYIENAMGSATLNITNTAYNVSFNWSIPSGLVNVSGNLIMNFVNITDNTPHYNNLSVSFLNLSLMTQGSKLVYLYAYGYNLSGGNITDVSGERMITEVVNITFLCYNVSDGICVTACGHSLDTDCPEPVLSSGGGASTGGLGGGAGGGGGTYEKSNEKFELLRGEEQSFPLVIENKYLGRMRNITIAVSGINSEYVLLSPSYVSSLNPNSTSTVSVMISAPSYFSKGSYDLNFEIRAVIMSNNTATPYLQRRSITLYIVEVPRTRASEMINQSIVMIDKMNSSKMYLEDVLEIFKQVNSNFEEINFLGVKEGYEQLKNIYASAFESEEILFDLQAKIKNAEERGIVVLETKKVLYMAEVAFNRGDYLLSLSRLKEAQLTYALEVKGEFSIIYTVKNHPLESVGTLLGLFIFSFGSSLGVRLRLYKKKFKMLMEEEKLLLELMKVVQTECFEKNRMSMEEYESAMNQYETKLSKTIADRIKVDAKISNLLKIKGKKKALIEEKKRLLEVLKQIQDDYLNKGKLETRIYQNMLKNYTARLTEVEEKATFLDAQKALKKTGFVRRLFRKKPKKTK